MSYSLSLLLLGPEPPKLYVSISTPRITMISGDCRILGQIFDFSFRRATEPDVPKSPTVRSQELPIGIQIEIIRDDKIVLTNTTKYGDPYRITTAGELKKIVLPSDCDTYDRAAKAYLDKLPDHWQVIIELN